MDLKNFAPPSLKALLKNEKMVSQAKDIISKKKKESEVRTWADPKEKQEITELSNKTIELLQFMFETVKPDFSGKALEVACGRGILTQNLLIKHYDNVHLFDRDAAALRYIKFWKNSSKNGTNKKVTTEVSSMQHFQWTDRKFTGVYFRWCLGYLNDQEGQEILI